MCVISSGETQPGLDLKAVDGRPGRWGQMPAQVWLRVGGFIEGVTLRNITVEIAACTTHER